MNQRNYAVIAQCNKRRLYPLVDDKVKTKLLANKIGQEFIEIMIHEQFFFEEYPKYEGNAKEKVLRAVSYLCEQGYESCFLNEII